MSTSLNVVNKNYIKMDIGGKKIKITQDLLEKSELLRKIINDTEFIDMDPVIFNYLLQVIKLGNTNTEHHKKYNNTLVKMKILNENFLMKPKIILNNPFIYNEEDKYNIIKINLRGNIHKTFKKNIMKSTYLIKKLAQDKVIYLDEDYKSFSYILNLLRNNSTCYFPKDYYNLLDKYELDYTKIKKEKKEIKINKKKNDFNDFTDINSNSSVLSNDSINYEKNRNIHLQETYLENKTDMTCGLLQIASNNTKIYEPIIKKELSNYYPYSDRVKDKMTKIYTNSSVDQYFTLLPTHTIVHQQINSEKYSIVEKEINVNYGKTIVFDLKEFDYGDLIDDMILVIDLESLENGRWVNKLGNMIVKRYYFNINGENKINCTGEYLDIYDDLFLKNNNDNLNIVYDNNKKGNNLSKRYNRIMIPFKLNEKIPIAKDIKILLYVELQEKNKCIIPLEKSDSQNVGGNIVNLSLLTNYINLEVERNKIINSKNLYIYDNIKLISKNIEQNRDDNDYSVTVIPLDSFDYIKDLTIVIHEYSDIENKDFFKYSDSLLDAELLIGDKNLFKLDKLMLNKYLPYKYFGKIPKSRGIYYYSFSTKPNENGLYGGFNINFEKKYKTNLVIRTLPINGVIHIYSNNYFITSI